MFPKSELKRLDVQLEGKSLGEAYLIGKSCGKEHLVFLLQIYALIQTVPPEKREQVIASIKKSMEQYLEGSTCCQDSEAYVVKNLE